MNCPKCGKEINDNQKFCRHCGTKIEIKPNATDINSVDNKSSIEIIKEWLKEPLNKVYAAILIVLILTFGIWGGIQYKQYLKDIEPYETTTSFVTGNDVICKLTYDTRQKNAKLSLLHKGTIIEQWQIDYLNELSENNPNYELTDENNNYIFRFDNKEILLGKPLVLNFRIDSVNNPKDFVKLKEKFDKIGLIRSIPFALNEDINKRNFIKKEWLAEKEAERKQREWQEMVLANSVYKTSDGVYFMTEIFKVEPLLEYNPKYSCYDKNYWLGAKDYCECRGYKLPSDQDLISLFSDILGIKINPGLKVRTTKSSYSTIPTNYEILKKIDSSGHNWDYLELWEDREFNGKEIYCRYKTKSWGDDETYQTYKDNSSSYVRGICVYDPNGKPHKSLVQIQKEKFEQERKMKEEKFKQETKKEAENDLF